MIWKSVRHILFAEYAAYLLLAILACVFGLLLRLFGVHPTISYSVLPAVWLALFLLVYRIRYRRF
jgi:hypothetical protein